MKKLIFFFPLALFADLVQVPIYEISDNLACNYFFSLIFYVFLFATPCKIALQILWDYALTRKS